MLTMLGNRKFGSYIALNNGRISGQQVNRMAKTYLNQSNKGSRIIYDVGSIQWVDGMYLASRDGWKKAEVRWNLENRPLFKIFSLDKIETWCFLATWQVEKTTVAMLSQ